MKKTMQLLGIFSSLALGAAPAWFTAMKDNTWKAVASTGTIASVAPTPTPPGAEGISAVCNDWTGAVANQTTGEYILPAQGGHNGYYGNEIYALALRDDVPAWKRIWGPTPNNQISTGEYGYNAAYTAYADGSPRTAHGWFSNFSTNDGNIWCTLIDACGSGEWTTEVYSINRNNLGAGWTYHGRIWPIIPGGSPGSSFGYQAGPGGYDPVGNKIWRCPDFSTDSGIAAIDVGAAVSAGAQAHSGPRVPGTKVYDLYQVSLSAGWSAVTSDLSPRCWIVGARQTSELWIMDLENNPGKFVKKSTTGSPTGWDNGAGAVYHKQSRSILVGEAGYGANIRKLSISGTNPLTATYTWSAMPVDASNTVVPNKPSQMQGTYAKFQMIEDMGNGQSAICMVTSANGPTFIYKIPGIATSVEKTTPDFASSSLTLSPNPVNRGRVTIRVAGTARGGVYDMRGRRLAAFSGPEFVWETKGVSPGLYVVRAATGNREFVKRLVLQ